MYDTISADIRCTTCGVSARAVLQTKLRGHAADVSDFHAGDVFTFDRTAATEHGYFAIQPLADPTRVVFVWDDAPCGHFPGWIEVVFAADRIATIEAVVLDAATFARIHLLDEDAGSFIAARVGVEPYANWTRLVDLGRAWLAEDPAREL